MWPICVRGEQLDSERRGVDVLKEHEESLSTLGHPGAAAMSERVVSQRRSRSSNDARALVSRSFPEPGGLSVAQRRRTLDSATASGLGTKCLAPALGRPGSVGRAMRTAARSALFVEGFQRDEPSPGSLIFRGALTGERNARSRSPFISRSPLHHPVPILTCLRCFRTLADRFGAV